MAAELMVSNVLWSSFTISIINLQEDYTGDSRFVEWTLFKVNEDNNKYDLQEIKKFKDWLDNQIPDFSREIKDLVPLTKYIVRAEISNLSNTFKVVLATGEVETTDLPPSVEESKRPIINGPNFQNFLNEKLEKEVSWNVTVTNIRYAFCTLILYLGNHELDRTSGEQPDKNFSLNINGTRFLENNSEKIPSGRYRWTIQVEVKNNENDEPIVFKKTGYFCWFAFGQIDAIWEEKKTIYLNNYKDKVQCSIYPVVDRQLFFEIIKEVNNQWHDGDIEVINAFINVEKKISKELFEYIYNTVLDGDTPFPDYFPFYVNETNNCFYNLQQVLRSYVG